MNELEKAIHDFAEKFQDMTFADLVNNERFEEELKRHLEYVQLMMRYLEDPQDTVQ